MATVRERLDEMEANFLNEANDEDTREWRDALTHEEAMLVAEWDEHWNAVMDRLERDIAKAAAQ
ncbi:MAG: hypothetical protein FWG61_00490 [Firmicutes bacterium]|nr:hypothetical protein [Bacillota bacterium]